jgi:hypothetical protein
VICVIELEENIVDQIHELIINLLFSCVDQLTFIVNKVHLRSYGDNGLSIADSLKQIDKSNDLVGISSYISNSEILQIKINSIGSEIDHKLLEVLSQCLHVSSIRFEGVVFSSYRNYDSLKFS